MTKSATFVRTAVAAALLACSAVASSAITYIGMGVVPGNARDQSPQSGLLEDNATPRDLAGGFGSAIAYTGRDNLYVATPDRGPADGTTSYIDRIYTLSVDVARIDASNYRIVPHLVATRLLRADEKTYFTGSAKAFDETGSPWSLRLDPEGVRVSRCGTTAYISDEYGPYLYEFDLETGLRLRSLALPNKLLIDFPSEVPNDELAMNASGRQSNRGMEGLAISPDGRKLYGIMQSPLIQDGGLNASLSRVGINNRIVEIDVDTGDVREFLYRMDSASNGVSEIVAVNDHELLVLERDGRVGAAAAYKKIVKIDIAGATDVRGVKQLPVTDLPEGITPVAKMPFIDMLRAEYGLAGPNFPEKLEGLAFGPDLEDGRRLLLVTTDNDFVAATPTRFFAFAIDRADLAVQPQRLPGTKAQSSGEACR